MDFKKHLLNTSHPPNCFWFPIRRVTTSVWNDKETRASHSIPVRKVPVIKVREPRYLNHTLVYVQSCAGTKGNKSHNLSPPERSDGTLWVSSLCRISAILCWRLGNSLDFFGVLPDIHHTTLDLRTHFLDSMEHHF